MSEISSRRKQERREFSPHGRTTSQAGERVRLSPDSRLPTPTTQPISFSSRPRRDFSPPTPTTPTDRRSPSRPRRKQRLTPGTRSIDCRASHSPTERLPQTSIAMTTSSRSYRTRRERGASSGRAETSSPSCEATPSGTPPRSSSRTRPPKAPGPTSTAQRAETSSRSRPSFPPTVSSALREPRQTPGRRAVPMQERWLPLPALPRESSPTGFTPPTSRSG